MKSLLQKSTVLLFPALLLLSACAADEQLSDGSLQEELGETAAAICATSFSGPDATSTWSDTASATDYATGSATNHTPGSGLPVSCSMYSWQLNGTSSTSNSIKYVSARANNWNASQADCGASVEFEVYGSNGGRPETWTQIASTNGPVGSCSFTNSDVVPNVCVCLSPFVNIPNSQNYSKIQVHARAYHGSTPLPMTLSYKNN